MKKFICPEVEFIKLDNTDIIATSNFNLVDDVTINEEDIQARESWWDD